MDDGRPEIPGGQDVETGDAMRTLRQALGLTQEELATRLNASRSFVAQLETGRMPIPEDRWKDIAAVFLAAVPEALSVDASPSVVLAMRVLAAEAQGLESDDSYAAIQVHQETMAVVARIAESLAEGERGLQASEMAPLVGLILWQPDVATTLLIALATSAELDGRFAEADVLLGLHLRLLAALHFADRFLEVFEGGNGIIYALTRSAVFGGSDSAQRCASIQTIRDRLSLATSMEPLDRWLGRLISPGDEPRAPCSAQRRIGLDLNRKAPIDDEDD